MLDIRKCRTCLPFRLKLYGVVYRLIIWVTRIIREKRHNDVLISVVITCRKNGMIMMKNLITYKKYRCS